MNTDNNYEKVVKLLEDLTPGGSEFYNDPEYCAKWAKEQIQSVPKLILPIKKENERLKGINNNLVQVLKTVLKTIETSEQWWIDVPGRGGFDVDTIELAIKEAEQA